MNAKTRKDSPDFELLASAANFLKSEFPTSNPAWDGSPFEWILSLPSRSKGKLGERLVIQWSALKGLSVDKSPDSDADMLINGHRVEVKFSTLWKTGIYKFQQIRDQDYDFGVFLGISPFEAHCWVVSKELLKGFVIGHMGQHTGATGKETAWLTVDPNKPPTWLSASGGTLEQAFEVLRNLSSKH